MKDLFITIRIPFTIAPKIFIIIFGLLVCITETIINIISPIIIFFGKIILFIPGAVLTALISALTTKNEIYDNFSTWIKKPLPKIEWFECREAFKYKLIKIDEWKNGENADALLLVLLSNTSLLMLKFESFRIFIFEAIGYIFLVVMSIIALFSS